MIKAVAYLRVSTQMQEESGLGKQAQLARVKALAQQHGAEIVHVIEDAETGKTLDRPGFKEAMRLLDDGQAQCLIAAKMDRLSRSVVEGATLIQHLKKRRHGLIIGDIGVDTTSASGELLSNVLLTVAQFEARIISDRTSAAMQQLPRALRGGLPFGWSRNGQEVVPEPDEQATLQRAIVLKAQGESFAKIASALNAENRVTRQGAKWTKQNVYRVLKNATKLSEELKLNSN